jgi:hypothetical protein
MAQKEIPTGVKIISVLYYIGAVLFALLGILFIVGAGMINTIASEIPLIAELGAGLFVVAGIIMIALGVLAFFIGKGLWKAKSWARILVIILSCLGVLSTLISMIQGDISSNIFNLLLNGVIGGYLWFNNSVKKAFA